MLLSWMPPLDIFRIFSKKKSVERSQNNQRVTPRGQSLPTHLKVLLFFLAKWNRNTSLYYGVVWRVLKQCGDAGQGASLCSLGIRTESQAGLFKTGNRKEASSCERQCCAVSQRAASHCVSLWTPRRSSWILHDLCWTPPPGRPAADAPAQGWSPEQLDSRSLEEKGNRKREINAEKSVFISIKYSPALHGWTTTTTSRFLSLRLRARWAILINLNGRHLYFICYQVYI